MSNKLQVVQKELAAASSVKEMLGIPIVQDRFITNYEKTTGKKDGPQRFQQEVLNFLEIANENKAIMKCDRFSIFAAIVKAGTTGLSFRDGHLYPIPYGQILKTSIGAHGKREMLMRMPTIEFVSEAQVVMKGDKFVYDKANSIVMEHPVDMMGKKIPLNMENIMGSYFRIEFTSGRVIDVLMTQDDLMKARGAAKTKQVWDAWPGEMSKKSVYNRGYKLYHRYPEGEFGAFPEYDDDNEDPTPIPTPEPAKAKKETAKTADPAEEPKPEPSDIEDADVIEEEQSPDSPETQEPKEVKKDIF